MAALTDTMPTLLDISRALDPKGQIATIAEILQTDNEVLDDVVWQEGNLPTGHQSNIRTSLPTPSFRLLNGGVVPVKSSNGQIVDTCAILEARGHVDVDVANLNGNAAAYRKSEDTAFIQGFNKTFVDTLIYGDTSVYPDRFNGLASRYYSLSGETTSAQVIDGGGTGSDNTSIYLLGWSPRTAFCIYPKGSKAGLQMEDRGIEDVMIDYSTGAYMRAYVSWFQWKCGLVVSDYRYVVRIANIDVSALLTAGDTSDTSANIMKLMIRALSKIPSGNNVKLAFYMNETVKSMLAVKMLDKGNGMVSINEMKNSPIYRPNGTLSFQGVPCRRVDSILNTETALT